MPMKTIITRATLHVKDEKRSKAFKYGPLGDLIAGKLVVIEVPPGTAVSLDEDESARIVARHGGEYVDTPATLAVAPKVDPLEGEGIVSLAEALTADGAADAGKPAKGGKVA